MSNIIGTLKFRFTPLPYPYNDEQTLGTWGRIELIYQLESQLWILLDWQWEVVEVDSWYRQVKQALFEVFPFDINNSTSIAECKDILYDREIFDNETEEMEYYDSLVSYFENHIFHLSGTDTPFYLIGLFNGSGQISYINGLTLEYEYHFFELNLFLSQLDEQLNCFNQKKAIDS